MRTDILLPLTLVVGACAAPVTNRLPGEGHSVGKSAARSSINTPGAGAGRASDAAPLSTSAAAPSSGPALDGSGPAPSAGGAAPPDADGDGVPDALDCDPRSAALGARIVEDDLSTANGVVQAAPGFDPAAWLHAAGAYQEQLLRDQGEASFVTAAAPDAFSAEVHVSATQIGAFSPELRQQMLVVGASAASGGFAGFGCGVEAVEGASPEWKTSLVQLTGAVTAIATDPIRREDAPGFTVGVDVAIAVRLSGGTLTCTVTQGTDTTTLAAPGVGAIGGAVGFYTRQAKAAFSRLRVCQLPS
jgi:hypothetical protein